MVVCCRVGVTDGRTKEHGDIIYSRVPPTKQPGGGGGGGGEGMSHFVRTVNNKRPRGTEVDNTSCGDAHEY